MTQGGRVPLGSQETPPDCLCQPHSCRAPGGPGGTMGQGSERPAAPLQAPAVSRRDSCEAPSFGLGRTKHEGREGISSHPTHCSPEGGYSPPSSHFLLLGSLGQVGLGIVQVLQERPPWAVQGTSALLEVGEGAWGLLAPALGLSPNLDSRKSPTQPVGPAAISHRGFSLRHTLCSTRTLRQRTHLFPEKEADSAEV